jgi:putative toxin-antitoxin system antitoxin component (TIGR02293 family)
MSGNRGFGEAPIRWMAAIREGLSVDVVDDVLAEGRLTLAELDRLALPRKTLAHRRTLGRLTAEQSDRLVRILRVIEQAELAFGDVQKARTWLRRPSPNFTQF